MRRTLVAMLFTLGLAACGGMEDASAGDDGSTRSGQDHPNPGIQCSQLNPCAEGYVCCPDNSTCRLPSYCSIVF